MLAEVCRQIEGHGPKMKEVGTAIITAALIESSARAGIHVDAPPENSAKNEAADESATDIFSTKNDACRIKIGRKHTQGCRGYALCD